jgi:Glycosyltransferase family 52.
MKELNKGPSHRKEAKLILSTMSNDFGTMKDRAESSGIYKDVYLFDEKEDVSSPEVMAYHEDKGNIVSNLLQRIKYTRMLAKLQEPFVPVDLSSYDEVYVFCDSDPIGYYLNYKKIRYHALEDGLNSGKLDNQAMLSNKGAWPLKKLMAKMGLIFIESGYSRYCIDYEVNDISANYMPPDNVIECSFDSMWDKLSKEDHDLLAYIFMENIDEIKKQLESVSEHKERVMILTEPLCDFETRKRLFGDIIKEYQNDYDILIKPHPRDLVDYKEAFPQVTVLQGKFPMEVIADIDDLKVEKLVSVITQVDNVKFADEIVYLGLDFLDKYEDPAIHRKMENLING